MTTAVPSPREGLAPREDSDRREELGRREDLHHPGDSPSAGGPAVPPRVLSIAGTDPTGGAGIQADLKAIAACGGYGMAVVTALVAQNTRGVRSVHVPPTSFLREQLDAVGEDVAIDAVKTGMLFDAEIIAEVSDFLERTRPPIVVMDPVMVATSGDRLLRPEAEQGMRELLERVDLVTPNVPELAVLLDEAPARGWEELIGQAQRLAAASGTLVHAKGGHLKEDAVQDALVDADGVRRVVSSPRLSGATTHGTGCSLSAAMATLRVRHGGWERALEEAKPWLAGAIAEGEHLDVGGGTGPVSHFWALWEAAGIR